MARFQWLWVNVGAGNSGGYKFWWLWDAVGGGYKFQEQWQIALPTALALMANPIASLIETTFIGHIG